MLIAPRRMPLVANLKRRPWFLCC